MSTKNQRKLFHQFLDNLDANRIDILTRLIEQIQVWMKAKGIYESALKDIDALKYYNLKYLIIKKEIK